MESDPHQTDARTKTEQIIREIYVKLIHVILQSRVPNVVQQSSNNNGGKMKINKWFNLEGDELENITQELMPWRQNVYLPLCIKIFFNSKKSSQQHEERVLLEKWKIQFEPHTGPSRENVEVPTLYKKLVILIRSIYSFLRVVPAYRVFRDCNRNKMMSGKMFYKIDRYPDDNIPGSSKFGLSSESGPPSGFSEFKFDVINTVLGKLNVVAHSSETCTFKQLAASSGETIISSGMLITDYQPSSYESNDQKLQIQLLQQQLLQTQNMVLQQQQLMDKLSTTPPSAHQIQQYLALHQQSYNSSSNPAGSFPPPFGSLPSQHSTSPHSNSSTPRSFGLPMNINNNTGFSPSSLPTQPISQYFVGSSNPIGIPHTFSPPSSMMTTNNSLDPNRSSGSSVSPQTFQMQHFSPPFSSRGFNVPQPQNMYGLSTTPPLAPLTMSTSVPNSFGRQIPRPPTSRQQSGDFGALVPSQTRFNNNSQLPFYSLSDIPLDPSQFSSGSEEVGEEPQFLASLKSFRDQDATDDIGYFAKQSKNPPLLQMFLEEDGKPRNVSVGSYNDLFNQLIGFDSS